jgi:hypothetical protein
MFRLALTIFDTAAMDPKHGAMTEGERGRKSLLSSSPFDVRIQ